jgi:Dyp-type peroxidase family
MPVDLEDTDIDPTLPKYRRLLANLQGNILKAHGRKESDHLLLRFTGAPDDARHWIRRFARDHVPSAQVQLDECEAYREKGTPGSPFASVALSAKGYEALGLVGDAFGSAGTSFRNGMKARPLSLLAPNRDPPVAEWEEPYRGDIHALIVVADDSAERVEAQARAVTASLEGLATVLAIERATVLRNAKGEPIEHFGYIDARSQPLFLKADLDAERAAGVDIWDPSAPLSLVLVDDPFTNEEDAFGSYLVFRKLAQDVDGFNAGVSSLASRIRVDEPLAGALVVGRFKDGTPVTLRPWDRLGAVNNFEYTQHDGAGNRCPFHAHIRKANQRGGNPLLSDGEERRRRIVRRGIPYGVRPAPAGSPGASVPSQEKGLLFMCFQANLARQFEFIQRTWVDNPNFPEFLLFSGLNTGDDSLIGQRPRAAQKWPLRWGRDDRFLGRERFDFGGYVRLRGGEYFFTPSLPFLKDL